MQHSPEFLKLVNEAKARIEQTTVEAVNARRVRNEPVTLVDVREDDEWREGRIAGARHLGKGILERDVEATFPDRDAELVLYCGGGFRSALAADALQRMGYRKVVSMDGGWKAWVARGYATEK